MITKEQLDEAMEKMKDEIPKHLFGPMKDNMHRIFVEDNASTDEIKASPEMKQAVFNKGYQLLQGGKYKAAAGAFYFLYSIDPIFDYAFPLAVAYHYLKEYDLAGAHYVIASQLDPLNPVPTFHLYDCFMKLNLPYGAMKAISDTIALCKDDPQYATLKERANLEKDALQKIIVEDIVKEAKAGT